VVVFLNHRRSLAAGLGSASLLAGMCAPDGLVGSYLGFFG
jgi:hypothetical protein